MLELDGLAALVVLGLWIFCLIDVITTDEYACRNLGKTLWLILVLLLPAIGSIAWLVAGRPQEAKTGPERSTPFPEYDRPGRATASNPEDDEAFLRGLRERAEEQRAIYRAKKRQELGELGETEPPSAD
ncbi:MAG: hypothetical protein QOJ72_1831 [Nocardioidaceae bacterium]|jgi:hypothetical protein|nr:hypothetical protein [Nocardioidaceae bacterium]